MAVLSVQYSTQTVTNYSGQKLMNLVNNRIQFFDIDSILDTVLFNYLFILLWNEIAYRNVPCIMFFAILLYPTMKHTFFTLNCNGKTELVQILSCYNIFVVSLSVLRLVLMQLTYSTCW